MDENVSYLPPYQFSHHGFNLMEMMVVWGLGDAVLPELFSFTPPPPRSVPLWSPPPPYDASCHGLIPGLQSLLFWNTFFKKATLEPAGSKLTQC